jgi:hypothetical protein
MTDHTVSARFVISPSTSKITPLWGAHHFKNFSINPDGSITIKNFNPLFRDKLREVLMDDTHEFSPILSVKSGLL